MKVLETERLILRNWKISDSEDLYEYAQSELVGPYAGWKPHENEDESKEIIKMFIEKDDVYAIELKSVSKVIGSIGIHKSYPDKSLKTFKQREIGYVLNPEYWGNGYVPEAVKCVCEFIFNNLGIELIWCGHFDFNMKSKRVNEKCGFNYQFSLEETLKLLNNKKVLTLYYNIFKEE